MRYLVTGAAGFIGSHITHRLVEDGHEVIALDNFATGYRRNLAEVWDDIEFVEGDIRDLETCHNACKGVDHVLHQAALGSVPRSVADPLTSHASNATGTLHMLIAARDAEVDSFVYAASSSFYGDTEELPKHEGMAARPLSPYATTKAMGTFYVKNFALLYDLPAVGVRYFNIFGPRQDPNGPYAAVIPKFIQLLLDGEAPTINGDGNQTRDFTYVANAVDANLLASKHAGDVAGNIFNVACGERTSINELYRMIASHLGVEIKPNYGPPRPGDVSDSLASLAKAKELIGYTPRVKIDEGLASTVDWFRERHAT